MATKLEEMLAAHQAPGVVVRSPVRSAVMRDRQGKSTRVLYAGQEHTGSVERDMVELSERDGLDLRSAQMEIAVESGQGVGKKGHRKLPLKFPAPARGGSSGQ